MTEMRTGLVLAFAWLSLGACGSAQALSCGESVRVENHTDGHVTVLIKSFYGLGFERPDPNDFAPETTWRPGTMPLVSLHEVPMGPGAADNVFVRTLCSSPERRHWINWSYSIDGATPVAGQENLINASARIIVQPPDREASE